LEEVNNILHFYQYRIGREEKDPNKIENCRAKAHSYVVMRRDVGNLVKIRELDSGDKMKPRDLIRATAARVGLGVPQVTNNNTNTNSDIAIKTC